MGPWWHFPGGWIRGAALQVGVTVGRMGDGRTQVGGAAVEGQGGGTRDGLTAVEKGDGWTQVGFPAAEIGDGRTERALRVEKGEADREMHGFGRLIADIWFGDVTANGRSLTYGVP